MPQDLDWNRRLTLLDGDGDPGFMHVTRTLRRVERNWFHGEAPGFKGQLAMLFLDAESDTYLALTSRVLSSIEEQLQNRRVASVIVHRINNPGDTFGSSRDDSSALGMTILHFEGDRVPPVA